MATTLKLKNKKLYLLLSLILFATIIVTALVGLNLNTIYSLETINWEAQAIAQDIFNAVILAPTILVSAVLSYQKRKWAYPVWVGSLFYSIYTFSIYAFTIHFGLLFPVYVFVLGLSFYVVLFSLRQQHTKQFKDYFRPGWINKFLAGLLIFFGGFFYIVWESEIFQSLNTSSVPASIVETDLLTNPVHVLDLAFLLPAMIISGILLWNKKTLGYLLAPAIMTTKILFTLTIVLINLEFLRQGLESDLAVAIMFTAIFMLDLLTLGLFLKKK